MPQDIFDDLGFSIQMHCIFKGGETLVFLHTRIHLHDKYLTYN